MTRRYSYDLATSRNRGFIGSDDQRRLRDATVAIAGAGGDGGAIAVQLARLGVGGFRLADPECFDVENLNRQVASSMATVGTNKAEAVAALLMSVNPQARIDVLDEGVTRRNVKAFVAGADLVVDETEYTIPEIGIRIAREARAQGAPNLMAMNVGFGAVVTSFLPSGHTFERFLGVDEEADPGAINAADIPLTAWVRRLPRYSDPRVFDAVASGTMAAPSVAPGVALAASLAATQSILHLIERRGRPLPVSAPAVLVADAMDGVMRRIRWPAPTIASTYFGMLIRARMRRTPTVI